MGCKDCEREVSLLILWYEKKIEHITDERNRYRILFRCAVTSGVSLLVLFCVVAICLISNLSFYKS